MSSPRNGSSEALWSIFQSHNATFWSGRSLLLIWHYFRSHDLLFLQVTELKCTQNVSILALQSLVKSLPMQCHFWDMWGHFWSHDIASGRVTSVSCVVGAQTHPVQVFPSCVRALRSGDITSGLRKVILGHVTSHPVMLLAFPSSYRLG